MDLVLDKAEWSEIPFDARMAAARALLAKPGKRRRAWPALLAAACFAASSILFVTVIVLAPTPPFGVTKPVR